MNILIDLVTDRVAGAASRRLFANLQDSDLQPMRTSALVNELANHFPIDERHRAQAFAAQWPAAVEEQDRSQSSPDLRSAFPDAEAKDRKYLAAAYACRQPILITRDEPFLAATESAATDLGVRVVDPTTFEASLRESGDQGSAAGWSELSVVPASDQNLAALLDRFVNHSTGERKSELRHRLDEAFADPTAQVHCVKQESEYVALFSMKREGSAATVTCLRATANWRTPVLARRLLSEIRSKAIQDAGPLTPIGIEFVDDHADRTLEQAARSQSIGAGPDPLLVAISGTANASDLSSLIRSALGNRVNEKLLGPMANEPWELELMLEPAFVTDSDLPAYVVPIQGGWADRLVGASKVSPNLIGRDPSLARSPANVYFSGKNFRPQSPARLLWYRSRGTKCVYATSILRSSRLDSIETLWQKFGSSGVLTRTDLAGLGGPEKRALALRFDSTRVLEHEVAIQDFGLVPPPSLQPIDKTKAVEIIARGIEGAA